MRNAGILFIVVGFVAFIGFVWAMWEKEVHRSDEGGKYAYDYSDTPAAAENGEATWLDEIKKETSKNGDMDRWSDLDPVEFSAAVRKDDYTYRVRAGDTLESLAKKFLADETLVQKLIDANPELSSRQLNAGTELVIPFRYRR